MANNLACHAGDVVLLRARSSESEVTGPMYVSQLARAVPPAFGRRLQQLPKLSMPLKPGMRLARGLRGIGSHDRRNLHFLTGVDHLRVDVLLRFCGAYPPSRVVWCLGIVDVTRRNHLFVGISQSDIFTGVYTRKRKVQRVWMVILHSKNL